ncbi:hypothetical protein PDIG_45240 [Penicillium digitatum PHI26]|uniref:Uncharacterized protein n=2 Tax=Penicillium digitatum TaxID=36651 RepID=K9FST6_PEND2|nr:hypothetical protein PDIP_17180 [Penicillium digitatum Pd1]EKV12199.1 hypothetical protein PDIG_45240 [Penicillium digitatum PHI26]EKV20359.1 hypothetical protein PDIP_17180 [Penicillium digitatum Pd1]
MHSLCCKLISPKSEKKPRSKRWTGEEFAQMVFGEQVVRALE